MRIAIFDYKITRNNPIGSCHLAMLRALAAEHEFTVFAVEFENPCPEKIRFIRVPSPTRPWPCSLSFITSWRPSVICSTGSAAAQSPISSRHSRAIWLSATFSTRTFAMACTSSIIGARSGAKGLRGWFRWLDHQLHAWMENFTYPRAKQVVVPSRGLARELKAEFPYIENKLTVLPNPISLERLQMPAEFDRQAFRHSLGIDDQDLVVPVRGFGTVRTQGIALLLQALGTPGMERFKLIVGGRRT